MIHIAKLMTKAGKDFKTAKDIDNTQDTTETQNTRAADRPGETTPSRQINKG